MVEIYEDRPKLNAKDLEKLEPRRRLILVFTGDEAIEIQADALEELARKMRAVVRTKTTPPLDIKQRMMRCSWLARMTQAEVFDPLWKREKWAIADEKALKKTPPPREPVEYVPATPKSRSDLLNQYSVYRKSDSTM